MPDSDEGHIAHDHASSALPGVLVIMQGSFDEPERTTLPAHEGHWTHDRPAPALLSVLMIMEGASDPRDRPRRVGCLW